MFVEIGQDVELIIDDEDDDDGDIGEPPATLPFSQLLAAANIVEDGRRVIAVRFDDEPVDKFELVGDITVVMFVDEICF